jgi:Na+-transporting methylmalonyl-CoA/oxaloacetate decarboxylase gamma subunit
MIISLIIFLFGLLFVFLFLTWKAPLVASLSDVEDSSNDFIIATKEKIEEGIKKEVKEKFEEMLKRILSSVRRFLIKIEQITTRWLFVLKRKGKNKEENKPE